IEAHRGTSRSNDALYLERYALNGPRAFNYLKMALSMVPFVGTTIALYDAWTNANQAAAAFLRGRVGDGVAELESVLLCLIDAAMDILPGASAGGARPPGRRPQGGQDASSTTGIFPPAPGGDTPPQGHFSPDLNPIDSGSGTAARTDSPRPPSSSSSSRSGSPQDNLPAVMDNALHAMLQARRRQQDSPLPFTFPVGQESRFPIRPPSRPQVWIPTPELPTPGLHLPPLPTIPPVRRVLHPADSGNVMQPFKYRSEYQTQIHYRTRLREAVFEGYEYPKSLNLAGMQPGTAGAYRQVYRLAEGNFICRQGRIYEVELSQDSRGWRLSGTAQRTYKQPIALDDYGEWDTHFAVHGTTFDGGGLGGGNMLGHVANALDPLWPLAIRERLPRWWADRNLRRQQQLTREINSLAVQMDAQLPHSRKVLEQYNEATITRQISLFPTVEKTCRGDIEIAMRRYALAGELMPLSRGNKRRLLIQCMSQDAWKIADRLQVLVYCANHQTHPLLDQIDSLLQRLDLLPQDSLAERLSHLAAIRKLRVENLRQLDTIETLMGDFRLWYQRISQPADKANLRAEFDYLSARMSESNLLYIKTGNLLDMVKSYDHIKEASWLYFFRQESTLRDQVDRTLYMQYSLPQTHTTTAQRNQILQECLDTYAQFLRDMRVWTTTYPQHFHMDNVPAPRGYRKHGRARTQPAQAAGDPANQRGDPQESVHHRGRANPDRRRTLGTRDPVPTISYARQKQLEGSLGTGQQRRFSPAESSEANRGVHEQRPARSGHRSPQTPGVAASL
ncbi:hypothetical protein OC940_28860, partial [Pseudomonas koreensis]|nr:hypothetical protein [Pseudomonas koreensis]